MKKLKLLFIFLLIFGANLSAQQNERIDSVNVLDQVWEILDNNYPYFNYRGINWDAIHDIYSKKVNSQTSDEELFEILCNMLGLLNDGHVTLDNGEIDFHSGKLYGKKMEDFKWELVKDKYLLTNFKASPDSLFFYGWLSENIGYLRIRRFPRPEKVEKYIDSILSELIDAKGIIIDVRGNPGGNQFGVIKVANRFADQKRLFEKGFNVIGPEREFINPTYFYIEPEGDRQFTAPIVLLQNEHTASGAENFAIALRVLPNATSVGTFTEGVFSSYYPQRLENGWKLTLPFTNTVDQNGTCWEGIGVPPNLYMVNRQEDIDSGHDKVLEFAINLIRSGSHFREEEQGSLNDMRVSIVDKFIELNEKKELDETVNEIEDLLNNHPDEIYFSIQELMLAARKLLGENKISVLESIMEFGIKAFPEDISTIYFLALAYEKNDKTSEARELYEKISESKVFFPWEEYAVAKAKEYLNSN